MTNKCVAFIGATGATSGTAMAHVVQHHCGRPLTAASTTALLG